MKTKLFLILLISLLMLGGIFIVGTTMTQDRMNAPMVEGKDENIGSIPSERGVFNRSKQALDYGLMPEGSRKLVDYYKNRAYTGAPPTIPHPVLTIKGIGGKNCLQCHKNGGYVPQFKAFSPITPHPEMANCRQCHVPVNTEKLFKETNWEKNAPPEIKQSALVGSPPMMPHGLQLRENCLSCHAGPSAPKEIRVSHPERVNCRQCHLPQDKNEIFTRPNSEEVKGLGLNEVPLKEQKISMILDWVELGRE